MDPHAHRHPGTPRRGEGHSHLALGDRSGEGGAGANQDGSRGDRPDRARQRYSGHVFSCHRLLSARAHWREEGVGLYLSAACSGFAYALTVGAQFVGAGTHKKALVIGSDTMTSVLDYKDRATCVLFGDGAGAVLLEAAGSNEGILDFEHDVDGSGGAFLYMPGGGSLNPSSQETVEKRMHYVHQEGSQVFKYAVRRMAEMAAHLLERNGLTKIDLTLLVPH